MSGDRLDELLCSLIVDPADKQPLWYFAQRSILYNPRTQRLYDVREGIPVLLEHEARVADASLQDALAREPHVVTGGTPPPAPTASA